MSWIVSSSRLENVSRTKELPVLESVSSLTCLDGIIITNISDNFCIMLNLSPSSTTEFHILAAVFVCWFWLSVFITVRIRVIFRVMFNRTACLLRVIVAVQDLDWDFVKVWNMKSCSQLVLYCGSFVLSFWIWSELVLSSNSLFSLVFSKRNILHYSE